MVLFKALVKISPENELESNAIKLLNVLAKNLESAQAIGITVPDLEAGAKMYKNRVYFRKFYAL